MNTLEEAEFYKRKALLSAFIPFIFLFFMWMIKAIEKLFDIELFFLGIHPLAADGLAGIILSPFIHANINHLSNNSVALFLLSLALFFFYSDIAVKVFLSTWIFSGVLVWLAGREAWHIGARHYIRACGVSFFQRNYQKILQACSFIAAYCVYLRLNGLGIVSGNI